MSNKSNGREYMSDELINVLEPIAELLDNDYSNAYGVLSEVLNRLAEDGEDTLALEEYLCGNLTSELFDDAVELWNFID